MRHIKKVFMGVACSLFMIGCVADYSGAPSDDDGQPSTVEQSETEPGANAKASGDVQDSTSPTAQDGQVVDPKRPICRPNLNC